MAKSVLHNDAYYIGKQPMLKGTCVAEEPLLLTQSRDIDKGWRQNLDFLAPL